MCAHYSHILLCFPPVFVYFQLQKNGLLNNTYIIYNSDHGNLITVHVLLSARSIALSFIDSLLPLSFLCCLDSGYHLGQFNQQGEKRQPYDEDIRVPLIVYGPGIAPNTTTTALALNIDIVS